MHFSYFEKDLNENDATDLPPGIGIDSFYVMYVSKKGRQVASRREPHNWHSVRL
jgi:hypothetical protein